MGREFVFGLVVYILNQRMVCNNIDGKKIGIGGLAAVASVDSATVFAGINMEIEDILDSCPPLSLLASLLRV